MYSFLELFTSRLSRSRTPSEEFFALGDDNVCTAPVMAENEILEFVQSSKNIIDVAPEDENEMNYATLDPTSSEMRNMMKVCDTSEGSRSISMTLKLHNFSNATGVHGLSFQPKNLLRTPNPFSAGLDSPKSPSLSSGSSHYPRFPKKKPFFTPGVGFTLRPSSLIIDRPQKPAPAFLVLFRVEYTNTLPGRLETNGAAFLDRHLELPPRTIILKSAVVTDSLVRQALSLVNR
ncbi:hypothetical protein TNCV_3209881 [Trichonephila clavipes]|nr:hypothetical protein TNCV_3209881 [Trichonephila clavipes]